MNTVIRLTNLSKTFIDTNNNVHAVNGVDLSVNFGEIFGIIGSSGAGKSTLLRCINFLEIPTQGSVIFDGSDLGSLKHKKLRQARREIGMIFQSFNLLKQRTVFKNVLLPFEINRFKGTTRQKAHEKVLGLLELVGLSDKLNAYPAQLSGGQKQRVGVARALALDPKVLICDEATSALDPITTDSILSLLKDINQKFGITVVLITHQLEVVEKLCNRVAVMDEGKIVETGAVNDVFSAPKSKAARNLLFSYKEEFDLRLESYLRLKGEQA